MNKLVLLLVLVALTGCTTQQRSVRIYNLPSPLLGATDMPNMARELKNK